MSERRPLSGYATYVKKRKNLAASCSVSAATALGRACGLIVSAIAKGSCAADNATKVLVESSSAGYERVVFSLLPLDHPGQVVHLVP